MNARTLRPLTTSHAIAWALGALYGICAMEFGLWPIGIIVACATLVLRAYFERAAILEFRRRVRDESRGGAP